VRASPQGLALEFMSMEEEEFRILEKLALHICRDIMGKANRRRSQRVTMEIEVRVSGYNAEGVALRKIPIQFISTVLAAW